MRKADALHQALGEIGAAVGPGTNQNNLNRLRRKVLVSLQTHWPGLTLFADHPQIPMDNNGAERAIAPARLGVKTNGSEGWLPGNFIRYDATGLQGPPRGAPVVNSRARAP